MLAFAQKRKNTVKREEIFGREGEGDGMKLNFGTKEAGTHESGTEAGAI